MWQTCSIWLNCDNLFTNSDPWGSPNMGFFWAGAGARTLRFMSVSFAVLDAEEADFLFAATRLGDPAHSIPTFKPFSRLVCVEGVATAWKAAGADLKEGVHIAMYVVFPTLAAGCCIAIGGGGKFSGLGRANSLSVLMGAMIPPFLFERRSLVLGGEGGGGGEREYCKCCWKTECHFMWMDESGALPGYLSAWHLGHSH